MSHVLARQGGWIIVPVSTAQNLAENTTTSLAFVTKLTLTVNIAVNGTYRLGWSYTWRYSVTTRNFQGRIRLDAATILWTHTQEPSDAAATQRIPASGFLLVTLPAGSHTFALEFASSNVADTAGMSQAILEGWQIA